MESFDPRGIAKDSKRHLLTAEFKGIHADILSLQIQAIHCETLLLI
jgi:hypothetical protein